MTLLAALAVAIALGACSPASPTPASQTPEAQLTPVPVAPTADITNARNTIRAFVDAVTAADFATAWAMLGSSSQEGLQGEQAFAAERRAFMDTAGNTVVIGEPTRAPDQLSIWLDDSLREELDADAAFVVRLDYPVIQNNAGWEVLVVAPDTAGAWRVWPVR